jgi:hypothetical protein
MLALVVGAADRASLAEVDADRHNPLGARQEHRRGDAPGGENNRGGVHVMTTANAGIRPTARIGDLAGLLYFLAVTAVFLLEADLVAAATKAHPYAMGFAKFAVLATFGECLKNRIVTGRWIPSKLPARFVIWGVFGLWITSAFPMIDGGVQRLVGLQMWPDTPLFFWMSTWINLFSGYGFFMMFCHYWTDTMIVQGFLWPWHLFGRPETGRWGKIVLISLVLFWVPAHSLTFWLPPHWRILCAAYLGIALGLILSFAARRK